MLFEIYTRDSIIRDPFMFSQKIQLYVLEAVFVLCLIAQPVNAEPIGPQYVYITGEQLPASLSVEPSVELSLPVDITANASASYQFNMDTSQVVALINQNTNVCETGGGLVSRFWDTTPFVLQPSTNTELSVTLDATSIPLFTGSPIVNVLLYSAPRNGADFCIDILDTTIKNIAGVFAEALQQPGETYTFTDPQSGEPIVLQAGQSYYLYAHVAASLIPGTADVTFTFADEELEPETVPTMSVWGLGILAGLLGVIGIRRRMK